VTLITLAAQFAAAAPPLLQAIDQFLLPAGRSAANPLQRRASDRTDGQTPYRSIDPAQ